MNKRNRRILILLEELQEKNIYLYGAGKRGKVALENLKMLGLEQRVAAFVDDNHLGGVFCGKQIYSLPETLEFSDETAVYLITTYAVKQMVCKLMEKGILPNQICFFPELLIDNIEIETFRENKDKIESVYNMLEDNLSKFVYASLFKIYTDGNVGILSRTKGDVQYFPVKGNTDEVEGFTLTNEEVLIDCGAYDGDTIKVFKDITKNTYKSIWAFEPNEDSFKKLSDYIDKEYDTRVRLLKKGAYSDNAKMHFNSDRGASSGLNMAGDDCIEVCQIDSVVKEPVTFIKMDIEGAERDALRGAKEVISKYKPKLAICIYHQIEDFWEIPMLIKKLNPSYKIYIRNYEDRIDETVCYAISG